MGKRNKVRKIKGTAERPRLSVFRSNKHIYAQVIDDGAGQTIASCSTLDHEVKSEIGSIKPIDASTQVGLLIGQRLLEKKIEKVIFDRCNKFYHGNIQALAEGARSAGLKF